MNPDYHFGRCRSGRVRDADVHTLAEPKATYRAELHAVLHDVRAGAFDDAIEVESFWRCLGRSIVAEGSQRCCVVKEDSALCDAYAGELLIGRQHRLQRDIDDLPDFSNAVLLSRGWPCAATEHRREDSHSIGWMGFHAASTLSKGLARRSFTSV